MTSWTWSVWLVGGRNSSHNWCLCYLKLDFLKILIWCPCLTSLRHEAPTTWFLLCFGYLQKQEGVIATWTDLLIVQHYTLMRKCPSYRFDLGLFTLTLIIILRFYLNSLMPDLVVLSGSAQLLPSWLETFLRIEDSTLTQASCYYRPSHFLSHPLLVQHSIASPADNECSCSRAVPECKWRASFRPPALQSIPLYSVYQKLCYINSS